jgi:hypothetical protein
MFELGEERKEKQSRANPTQFTLQGREFVFAARESKEEVDERWKDQQTFLSTVSVSIYRARNLETSSDSDMDTGDESEEEATKETYDPRKPEAKARNRYQEEGISKTSRRLKKDKRPKINGTWKALPVQKDTKVCSLRIPHHCARKRCD